MSFSKEELTIKIENHKESIVENINKARGIGVSKITVILVVSEFQEEIQMELISWLLLEGYKVSLKKEEYNILTIEW